MYSIDIGDRELMLLFSKKGTLRGGHSHDVPEQVMVLTGEMRYHKHFGDVGESRTVLTPGACSMNAAGQVHMGEFLEDTWLIEFKLAKKGEWTQENYAPWRDRVEANAR